MAVADAVPPGASVADVGCGDGQLALHLAASGHRVIATEARPGPAARARERLGECRLGAGLTPLQPGEADVLVLAGMGGGTMARVLAASPEVAGAARLWILQPMQRVERLREWLAAGGHQVERELSSSQRRRVYTVLVVRPRAA
ncbi:MAG TPA: class I SAM-dependent methyltransferase [Candidatus Dormibacteraeota bacterium]